jgi:predicted NodU family carbamoyl transferase
MGYEANDIIYGLCQALVRNYLNYVSTGKEMVPPIVFQGGVAFNTGIIRAFEESLTVEVIVPLYHQVMGAIGAALLAGEEMSCKGKATAFTGFEMGEASCSTSSFGCKACPDHCEIAQIFRNDKVIACWGGRCDLWEEAKSG